MKKISLIILVLLLLTVFSFTATAKSMAPTITLQPQNPNYPEYSVAIYTVKAEGDHLQATWYMEWEGQTYTISNIGGSMQPWESYAGESYGAKKLDNNTFCFVFEGIGTELNGAQIWCVVEDGHFDEASKRAYISVGATASPPEILDIPSKITVTQGTEAEIRCVARSGGNGQLSYIWYETTTGMLQDIMAINRGEETSDFLFCDTSSVGSRYYVCSVSNTEGGMAYSSVVEVCVTAPPQPAEAEVTTQTEPMPTETIRTTETAVPETTSPAEDAPTRAPVPQQSSEAKSNSGKQSNALPWHGLLLIVLASAIFGVITAVLLIKKTHK